MGVCVTVVTDESPEWSGVKKTYQSLTASQLLAIVQSSDSADANKDSAQVLVHPHPCFPDGCVWRNGCSWLAIELDDVIGWYLWREQQVDSDSTADDSGLGGNTLTQTATVTIGNATGGQQVYIVTDKTQLALLQVLCLLATP